MRNIADGNFAPPRALRPDLPAELEAIILKCLSKRPEQRYQSMEEFAEDLKRFQTGTVPNAVSEMVARSCRPLYLPSRRR